MIGWLIWLALLGAFVASGFWAIRAFDRGLPAYVPVALLVLFALILGQG